MFRLHVIKDGETMDKKDFVGVFSRKNSQGVKHYYFVWVQGDIFSVQKLNDFFQPTEMLRHVDSQSFKAYYVHEPSIKKHPRGFTPAAEKKDSVAPVSDENVETYMRDLFKKATSRLNHEETRSSALPILENLLEVEEGITKEHKHMFNDFGIEMRKSKMHNHALAFCKRTISLSKNDDHAHFNAARILIEMGEYDEAEQHVLTAQYLNPDSRIYKKTLEYITLLRVQREEMNFVSKKFLAYKG